jgi:hypothetical protein
MLWFFSRSPLAILLIILRRLLLRLCKRLHHRRNTQCLRFIRFLVGRISERIEAAEEPELL